MSRKVCGGLPAALVLLVVAATVGSGLSIGPSAARAATDVSVDGVDIFAGGAKGFVPPPLSLPPRPRPPEARPSAPAPAPVAALTRTTLLQGRGGRIGALVRGTRAGYEVVGLSPDGPARELGICVGDTVTAVDGQRTRLLSPVQFNQKMRGPIGSPVLLSVLRKRTLQVQDFQVFRRACSPPTASPGGGAPSGGPVAVQVKFLYTKKVETHIEDMRLHFEPLSGQCPPLKKVRPKLVRENRTRRLRPYVASIPLVPGPYRITATFTRKRTESQYGLRNRGPKGTITWSWVKVEGPGPLELKDGVVSLYE